MVKLGREALVEQLAAFGLRSRSVTFTTEGEYQPSDVDWNIKDVQHLNPVHSWKKHVTAVVEEDLESQIDLQKVLGVTVPVVLVHYDAEAGTQVHFSVLSWIVVTEKQFIVMSPTRTREVTTYTVLAQRYLQWTFPIVRLLLRRNFARLMSEDVPIRERRGELRSWGYSFKGDERPSRDFRASLNIQRENVIRPEVDEPADHTVSIGAIARDRWTFVGRSDHRGLQLRRDDGHVVAFPRLCPHEGSLLDGREVRDGCITCPWHGRRIGPIATVAVAGGSATTDVHELEVRDGSLHVTACRSAGAVTRLTRPFGRPLHPIAATAAIGCWAVSLGFDVLSNVSELPVIYVRGAYAATAFGIAAAIVASLIGLVDLLELDRAGEAYRTGVRHLIAMDVGLVLLAVSFFVRRSADFRPLDATSPAATAVSVLGLIAVGVGLVHSGRLVYEHGVGRVGDPVDRSAAGSTAVPGTD